MQLAGKKEKKKKRKKKPKTKAWAVWYLCLENFL